MNLRQEVIKKIVHVGIALDESGSMAGCKKETLAGLNEQLQELKKHLEIDTTVTLVTFASAQDVKVKFSAKPITEIENIKDEDYKPDGMTAMYDGVARLLNELKQKTEDNESTTYLVLVVSDGAENSSIEYTAEQVAQLIKDRQNTKRWTVSYLGANQDLTKVQADLGVMRGSSLSYDATQLGTQKMWRTAQGSVSNYMTTRYASSSADAPDMQALSANFIQSVNTTDVKTDTNK